MKKHSRGLDLTRGYGLIMISILPGTGAHGVRTG
jgi:hypothetical protein